VRAAKCGKSGGLSPALCGDDGKRDVYAWRTECGEPPRDVGEAAASTQRPCRSMYRASGGRGPARAA